MNFIPFFLSLQNQLKVFHWQTTSYAQHMAFGSTYDTLDGLIDGFVEVCIGKHGRNIPEIINMKIYSLENKEPLEVVDVYIEMLVQEITPALPKEDTDLLNIKDEILASLNKLKYLLTLK
jgi:hypothetical protein